MRISDYRAGLPGAAAGAALTVLAALAHDPLVGANGPASAAVSNGRIPASLAAAHLVSGFRPLMADLMWIRADSLFRRGSLWELAALFRGIAAIDPRNSAVREFAAWHLAYNVALAERDPDRRFHWFAEGLDLLSDEPSSSRFRGRVLSFGGRMIADRMVSGVFPGFEARFEAKYGKAPLEAAIDMLSRSAEAPDAPPAAFASLAACLEIEAARAEDQGDADAAAEFRGRATGVLRTAKSRFPDMDWSFAGLPDD